MTPTRKAHLQVHLCVILWGFTAILGKLITLPALPLVWWRMGLVSVALLCLPRVWRGLRAMSGRLRLAYAGAGVTVALAVFAAPVAALAPLAVPESGKANAAQCRPLLDDLKNSPPKAPPPGAKKK